MMTQKFIETKTLKDAKKQAASGAITKKVEGGYMAFDTVRDYETWKKQK